MPYPTGHREMVRSRIVESARQLFNLNYYRLKAVGWCATESRGIRLKPSQVFPAQSRLKARWAR